MSNQRNLWRELEVNFRAVESIVYGPEAIRMRNTPEWRLEGKSRKAILHFQNTAERAALALDADRENHANIPEEVFGQKCPLDVWLTAVRLMTNEYVPFGGHYEVDPSLYKIDAAAVGKIPQVAYWSAELCHLLGTMPVKFLRPADMGQAEEPITLKAKPENPAPAAPRGFDGLKKMEPGEGLKEWGHLFTKKQFDIYHMIVDHQLPIAEVARRHGITRPSIDKQFAACRRKIEKYIENDKSKATKLADILLTEKIKREKRYQGEDFD
jgi:predicted DNA-binding protein YlxM (UPF0122 family)